MPAARYLPVDTPKLRWTLWLDVKVPEASLVDSTISAIGVRSRRGGSEDMLMFLITGEGDIIKLATESAWIDQARDRLGGVGVSSSVDAACNSSTASETAGIDNAKPVGTNGSETAGVDASGIAGVDVSGTAGVDASRTAVVDASWTAGVDASGTAGADAFE